jgi:hypothetical protein
LITEADDISGHVKMSMMGMDSASAETLVAATYEEAMKMMM